jgi:uncharacterized damage-inducible protein DinB
MNLTDLQDLYRHMEWADALVWQAVLASPPARQDDPTRELFYHLHLVQRAWLRAWRGQPHEPFPTFSDLPGLMDWGRGYYKDIFIHLENLTPAELSKTMDLPWAELVERELGRQPEATTIAETMLQIPLHSQYHRGQINRRLRQLGGEPPRVDYIVWVWLGRPEAAWESVALGFDVPVAARADT